MVTLLLLFLAYTSHEDNKFLLECLLLIRFHAAEQLFRRALVFFCARLLLSARAKRARVDFT